MDEPRHVESTPAVRQAFADLGLGGAKLAYSIEEAADAMGSGRTKVFEAIADGRFGP